MEKVLKFSDFTYRLAIVFGHNLTPHEKLFVEQCAGYSISKNVSREGATYNWPQDNILEINTDATKGRGDTDLFLGDFYQYLDEGSPKRVTQNYTRLIEHLPSIDAGCVLDAIGDDEEDYTYDERLAGYLPDIGVPAVEHDKFVNYGPVPDPVVVDVPSTQKTLTINIPEGATEVTVTFKF
jgi:hypothetical protein